MKQKDESIEISFELIRSLIIQYEKTSWLDDECKSILKTFFKNHKKNNKLLIEISKDINIFNYIKPNQLNEDIIYSILTNEDDWFIFSDNFLDHKFNENVIIKIIQEIKRKGEYSLDELISIFVIRDCKSTTALILSQLYVMANMHQKELIKTHKLFKSEAKLILSLIKK
jgi:hypothetical protein